MLAWSKAPRWEGLSRNTRGSHSTKHKVEHKHTAKHTVEHKHTGEKLLRAHWCTLLWSTAGGASDGQRWSVAKTSIYPPLSDAIEHKFVKTLIYHKLSLPAGWNGLFPTCQDGIFLFFGEFNHRLFLFGFVISIKSF